MIKGEGMGTMTLSMMTPTKTLQGPWARIESMIQLRISVNAVVLRLRFLLKIAVLVVELKRIVYAH
jgi:hypothetical protein